MNKYKLLIIFGIAGALYCSAQSFIDKFPTLTEKNLPEFFDAWDRYSDSIAFKNVINDTVLAKVINQELSLIKFDDKRDSLGNLPKFYVVPQSIEIDRYHTNVDTLKARANNGLPDYIPATEEGVYEKYTITPSLPEKSLYYTDALNKPLWTFLGGTMINGEREEINWENLKLIENYVPVAHGHWGGYWWFYSMPLINEIMYFDNLIIVQRRTSWHTGDLIWYVKGPDGFVRHDKPYSEWIE